MINEELATCLCGSKPQLIAKCSKPPFYYYVCYNCGRHTNDYPTEQAAYGEWKFMCGIEEPVEPEPEQKEEKPIRTEKRPGKPFRRRR